MIGLLFLYKKENILKHKNIKLVLNMQNILEKFKLIAVVILLSVSSFTIADGRRDATFGGFDEDLDNDGRRDATFGGFDEDLDRY